jgi:hypothetical protein
MHRQMLDLLERPMTPAERKRLLDSFGSAPILLGGALRTFPKKMWLHKPAPDRWSIHDHIIHLADREAMEYVFCRRLVAEPEKPTLRFDVSAWATGLGYFHQSTRDALRIITSLRCSTHRLLMTLRESFWHSVFEYSHHGRIDLASWLEVQQQHIPKHVEQMKQNYRDWLKRNPPRKVAAREVDAKSLSSVGT